MAGLNVHGLYTFNGPFTSLDKLSAASGVYLISVIRDDGTHYILDIGESHNVAYRVSNHDRKDQWVKASNSRTLHVSSYYCDALMRKNIESELRDIFNPVCGEL